MKTSMKNEAPPILGTFWGEEKGVRDFVFVKNSEQSLIRLL